MIEYKQEFEAKVRADEQIKVLTWALKNTDPGECYCCVGLKSCRGFAGEEDCIKTLLEKYKNNEEWEG